MKWEDRRFSIDRDSLKWFLVYLVVVCRELIVDLSLKMIIGNYGFAVYNNLRI